MSKKIEITGRAGKWFLYVQTGVTEQGEAVGEKIGTYKTKAEAEKAARGLGE